MSNEIVVENQKQGNPESEWGLPNGGSSSIEGFTADISYDQGGDVQFKINTDADHYRIDIYRLGYYNGDGARKVASIEHNGGIDQPDPIVKLDTATVDAGNWSVTDTWEVPSDAVSGVYIAKLVRLDGTSGENHIPFIVRDDDGHSDVVFQTSDTTWQAYNDWGGSSLYENTLGTGTDRAYAVSYNRPLQSAGLPGHSAGQSGVLGGEYTAIRWLEANGYDVSYIAGVDTARSGSELLEHKLFLSVGHDEYWSGDQFANVEAARDAGVNLAFWSGNEAFWKTRWEPSLDATPDAYRTLVTYKETAQKNIDPSPEWTGAFRDPMNPDVHPENALTGTAFMVNGFRADTMSVSSDFSKLRIWANTDIAHLQPGQSIQLAPGTLGYEWDIDWDNGVRPAGLIDLSSTTVSVNTLLSNPWGVGGWQTTTGNATHSLTLYRDDSGALVFSAGSVSWAWGLDSDNPANVPADPNVQQAMINLLAEMGIQPGTLKAGFVPGTQSTDHIAPEANFSSIIGNAAVGSIITAVGTAHDLNGVVAGVEVSADGGATWHKAAGSDSWSYAWVPERIGLNTIEVRAVDDSLNLGTPSSIQFVANFKQPGFDPGYYLDHNPDVKAAGVDPYLHYATTGWKEGRDPNAIFSTNQYLAANPDVAKSGLNPLAHFELVGWKQGRDPSSSFDVQLYLQNNPDVQAAGMNPLDHYLLWGQSQGRSTFESIGAPSLYGFDPEFYLFKNPDVAAAHLNPLTHYLQFGAKEGRDPNPYFDSKAYLAANPDVAASGMNPLQHYDQFGWKEGRDPSGQFDTKAYLAANSDVAAGGIDPLLHFLAFGIYEGRDPHADGQMAGLLVA